MEWDMNKIEFLSKDFTYLAGGKLCEIVGKTEISWWLENVYFMWQVPKK